LVFKYASFASLPAFFPMLAAIAASPMLTAATTATAAPPSVTLSNGVAMPILAFGANVWTADTCRNATLSALAAGFRFVWSSEIVGADCQKAQGEAIRSGAVKREEVFLAGTADTATCSSYGDCYDSTRAAVQKQFDVLGEPMLDMLSEYTDTLC
jgi:diketogulonate reductase-like aldo/keto reductase